MRRSYEAFANEIHQQWDFAVVHGMTFEPAPDGADSYTTSLNMAQDVRDHRHLYFFQGGEPHKFL